MSVWPGFKRMDKQSLLLVLAYLVSIGFLGQGCAEIQMVPMRDGIKLATQIYLPEGEGPWPTLLVRNFYSHMPIPAPVWPRFLNRIEDYNSWGYVVVSQDVRGFGDSGGEKIPFEPDGWGELQDGYDTVEWIAEQNWSNGKIGTLGGSGLGAVQNLMAGSYPPHLVCQFIFMAPWDQYSHHYPGGVFRKACFEDWYPRHATIEALKQRLDHPNYDWFWEQLDSETKVSGMTYPAFHVDGWFDNNLQHSINAYMSRQHRGAEGSLGNQRLVIGPWQHFDYDHSQGELEFPENADMLDWIISDVRAFFDYWLKGVDNDYTDLPAVRYYVMGDIDDPDAPGNEWRSADDWPIPCENLTLFLSQEDEVGVLTMRPESTATVSYPYDPRDPVKTLGGRLYPDPNGGPRDQRPREARDDVLVWTTQPLSVPVEVTGPVLLRLFASSSCPDTDFMAKLCDVYPDGRSMLVTEGVIRARHRESMATEDLMEPGEVYEFWIDLWATSIAFNKGHSIRVTITSSNYPEYDLNPNTGHPFRADSETQIALNTIHMGAAHPSGIILPLAGPDSDGDGTYDIQDPLPLQAGPHSKEDISRVIEEADQLVASVKEQKLRGVLEEASKIAKKLLADGDLAVSGHFALVVREVISYDIPDTSLPEAQRIVDRAMNLAMDSATEGRYREMIQYLEVGWKLGAVRQACDGISPLLEHLQEAEELMYTTPMGSARVAEWYNQTNVRLLAKDIQAYESSWHEIAGLASERDLMILEGILNAAKEGLGDMNEEVFEAKLAQFEQKLAELGIQIPEPTLLPLLSLILPALLKRGYSSIKTP